MFGNRHKQPTAPGTRQLPTPSSSSVLMGMVFVVTGVMESLSREEVWTFDEFFKKSNKTKYVHLWLSMLSYLLTEIVLACFFLFFLVVMWVMGWG